MQSQKIAVYQTPAVADGVVQFANDGAHAPVVTVENLDGAQSLSMKYQESDDGATWTDIAGTNVTVNPGEVDVQEVVSTRRLIRLHGGNDVQIVVKVDRVIAGSPTSLGSTN